VAGAVGMPVILFYSNAEFVSVRADLLPGMRPRSVLLRVSSGYLSKVQSVRMRSNARDIETLYVL